MADNPRVSIFDPLTGETEETELSSYIVLTNSENGWYVSAEQRYSNGTIQLTIKKESTDA